MRFRALKLGAGGVALLGVLGLAGWALSSRPLPVHVAAVEQQVQVRVFGLGTVEAQVLSKVGFEVGAALVDLRADHGDFVRKDEVLARLQSGDQAARLAKAKAGLASAEMAIRRAQANLEKNKSILAQKAQVNRRRQALAERNTVSVQTAEEAQKDEDVAQADLAVATADIDVLKATLADAQAQAALEQNVLDHYALKAPFDAVVVERTKELGSVVKAGDPIFTLVAPESVWVLAYVDESRSGAVAIGQAAEIRLRSLPQQRFKGKVVRIGIESDRVTEERRVWLKCGNCPAAFHLGEQAEVLITVASLPEARLVPEAAVQGFDGSKGHVWIAEDGRAARRQISFGYRTDDARVAIASDEPAAASVIADPPAGIAEGKPVRVVNGGKP